jgi:2'-5' RNA ligase
MREIKLPDTLDSKKTAGSYLMFSVIRDKDLEKRINNFLFRLLNSNGSLEFEPQDYPHVTLFATPDEISYFHKLELVSYLRSLLPPSNNLLDLEVTGVDLFSEDKQTLVVRFHSNTLENLNKKLCEFMSDRGFQMSTWGYNPHMTLGRVSRSNIYIPPMEDLKVKFKNVTLSIGF